jgi:hypothetical protein
MTGVPTLQIPDSIVEIIIEKSLYIVFYYKSHISKTPRSLQDKRDWYYGRGNTIEESPVRVATSSGPASFLTPKGCIRKSWELPPNSPESSCGSIEYGSVISF